MKSTRCVGLMLICLGAFVSPAFAQGGWAGRKFMPKDGCVMKVGNREIKTFVVPFVVRQVSGEWLWTGRGWVQMSRVVPLQQAAAYYTEYLRNHPGSASTYRNRGVVWHKEGKFDNALNDYTEAIRLDPKNALAYSNRGLTWHAKGEHDNALKDYTEAIRLDPQDAITYNNRGFTWRAKGEYDNALKDYTEAIRLDPQDASPHNGVAWLLATCPEDRYRDGQRAVTTARKACELSGWKDANDMGTLAAAYAESSDFDEAIRWQTKAMQTLAADAEYVKGARERLALYRQGKPYREAPPQ